jgi:hypothetical protein
MESVERVFIRFSFRTAVHQSSQKDGLVNRFHRMRERKCIVEDLLRKEGWQAGYAVMETLWWHLVPCRGILGVLSMARMGVVVPILRRRWMHGL